MVINDWKACYFCCFFPPYCCCCYFLSFFWYFLLFSIQSTIFISCLAVGDASILNDANNYSNHQCVSMYQYCSRTLSRDTCPATPLQSLLICEWVCLVLLLLVLLLSILTVPVLSLLLFSSFSIVRMLLSLHLLVAMLLSHCSLFKDERRNMLYKDASVLTADSHSFCPIWPVLK